MDLHLAGCHDGGEDSRSGQEGGALTTVHRSAVVNVSIHAPHGAVASWLSDVGTWTSWAPWIRSIARSSPRDWTLETEMGPMKVRFVEPNSLGVLDHHVTLASGTTVFNGMRVIPNGSGSELVMVLFQSPGVSSGEFERDIQAVSDDLARLKEAAERQLTGGAR